VRNDRGAVMKTGVIVRRPQMAFQARVADIRHQADSPFRRLLDIVGSISLILMAAIPMAVIMVIIKLSSPGPVFFTQRRFGLKGKEFRVIKFRTMVAMGNETSTDQARPGDSRITPVGRLLRRMSLDELPQLFNVLMGHMTFVGPRPHSIALNEKYRNSITGYMRRYDVKPGITGWAQVNGLRGHTPTTSAMAKRVAHDLWYVRNRSFWLDAIIVLKTMLIIFNDKNAC